MFNSKQQQLFNLSEKKATSDNLFINAAKKESAKTLSENGALKYDTTGNPFVDQFGKLGEMKSPRQFSQIATDCSTLWQINPRLTIAFMFFIRMITRVVSFFDNTKSTTVQRGAGLRHEGIVRMIWLHTNHTDSFWKNINLFISIGSWKDVIQMLSYDLQYNGWNGRILDWNNFGKLILAGLENPSQNQLIKKYLPQIKANSNCKTLEAQADNIIAKWICSLIFGSKESSTNYKQYRLLKSSGTAHQWQQLISQKKHNLIDFNTVHGRALALMVSGKFIQNQGLQAKYDEWISSKPIAKFTGYVHELFAKIPTQQYQIKTINAQFMGLVETAQKDAVQSTNFIVVRDTSGSMNSIPEGCKQTCFDIAKALALFFSYMLPNSSFANSFIEFNKSAKLHTWSGANPFEKWSNERIGCVGSTNFLSVIQLFCQLKQTISENEFPTGIICISDSEFDPAQLNKTNVQSALDLLRNAGFSDDYVNNFKIVLWNLQRSYGGNKFETYGDVQNVFYFSGYDASIMAFLTGTTSQAKEVKEVKTATDLFEAAMNQEVLNRIEV